LGMPPIVEDIEPVKMPNAVDELDDALASKAPASNNNRISGKPTFDTPNPSAMGESEDEGDTGDKGLTRFKGRVKSK
jgi:hypothetical protein